MINTNFQIPKTNTVSLKQNVYLKNSIAGSVDFKNEINKEILVKRNIISPDTNINAFFDEVSNKLIKDNSKILFSYYLKNGDIALSSSILNGTISSAVALNLAENEDYIGILDKYASDGVGIGINFSNFNNPIGAIKQINSNYIKKSQNYFRPPAFIGLLNIGHDKILDFITLKDEVNYDDWCFDLSVVVDDNFIEKLKNKDENTLKIYNTLLNSMKLKGEPGVIFSNDKNYICDCCAAKKLKENETLKTASINLSNMFKNGKADYFKLSKCANILAISMKKISSDASIGVFGYADLLKKLNLDYGSAGALEVLKNCLQIIKNACDKEKMSLAITPTTTPSIMFKATNGIEEDRKDRTSIDAKLKTLKTAYEYISKDGRISTTIKLQNPSTDDIDSIFKYAYKNNIKAFSVFSN